MTSRRVNLAMITLSVLLAPIEATIAMGQWIKTPQPDGMWWLIFSGYCVLATVTNYIVFILWHFLKRRD
jgi:hypothetical protein